MCSSNTSVLHGKGFFVCRPIPISPWQCPCLHCNQAGQCGCPSEPSRLPSSSNKKKPHALPQSSRTFYKASKTNPTGYLAPLPQGASEESPYPLIHATSKARRDPQRTAAPAAVLVVVAVQAIQMMTPDRWVAAEGHLQERQRRRWRPDAAAVMLGARHTMKSRTMRKILLAMVAVMVHSAAATVRRLRLQLIGRLQRAAGHSAARLACKSGRWMLLIWELDDGGLNLDRNVRFPCLYIRVHSFFGVRQRNRF